MLTAALAIALGVAALWMGGEQFVLGITRLAERTGLPKILIGMVVAGFGTSTPELAVSIFAQTRGDYEIALGNVLGSNVANVLLVLPVASLAARWTVRGELLRREIVAVLAATGLLLVFGLDGHIGRAEAGVLVATFVLAMSVLARGALRERDRPMLETEIAEMLGPAPRGEAVVREAVRTIAGLAVVLISADRLVWGAGRLARDLGVSEAAIGLTLVAVGTSLPEVVTSLVAARRGEPDLILGNVLGSNLFNALLVAGLAGLSGPLVLPGAARAAGLAGAGASALLLLAFLRPGYATSRRQAAVGLAAYAAFVALLYGV